MFVHFKAPLQVISSFAVGFVFNVCVFFQEDIFNIFNHCVRKYTFVKMAEVQVFILGSVYIDNCFFSII